MATQSNAFKLRGSADIDYTSEVFYINSTETNGSQVSIATEFISNGTPNDAQFSIYGGNVEDNLNLLATYNLDAATKEIPINISMTLKYLQFGIVRNSVTSVDYKIDGLAENSKTRN